jgi:hypothetical protein
MTADVKNIPKLQSRTKGSLATLLADIVVGCCARETMGESNANLERSGTIKSRFNPLLPSRRKFIVFAGPELIALLADDSSALILL